MSMIFRSLFVIAAVAAVAGAGTYALFSDTATVYGNTFSTGTMDIQIDSNLVGDNNYDWSDGFNFPTDLQAAFSNLKPGDSGHQVIDLKNVGTIDGKATIKFSATTWSALADNLLFTVTFDGDRDGVFTNPVSGTFADFNNNTYILGDITGANDTTDPTPTLGKQASVRIDWSIPESAGNNIQGKTLVFDTQFGINQ